MLRLFLMCVLSIFFISCAHHRDVRPGAQGVHRVVVQAEDTDEGSREAIAQANHFCKEKNKMAVFINEEQKYTGSMDESTYKTVKTVGKVASAAGGATRIYARNRKTKDSGGIVGLGGVIAADAAGEGYTVEMKFKCQ